MRSRIASVLAVGLFLVVTAVISSSASATPPPAPVKAVTCGIWRWPVKTLSDQRAQGVNYRPLARGVEFLRKVFAPGGLSETAKRIRKSPEMRTYRVHGDLIKAIREPDHDIHLVISVPGHKFRSMIVEFPDIACKGAAGSLKRGLISE